MMARWIGGLGDRQPNGLMIADAICSNCELDIKYPMCSKPPFPSRCIYCNTPMENGSDEYNDSYDKQTGYFKKASKSIEYHDKAIELYDKAQKAADEYATFTHYNYMNFRGECKEDNK